MELKIDNNIIYYEESTVNFVPYVDENGSEKVVENFLKEEVPMTRVMVATIQNRENGNVSFNDGLTSKELREMADALDLKYGINSIEENNGKNYYRKFEKEGK